MTNTDLAGYLASKGIRTFRAAGQEVTAHCFYCDDGDPKGKGKLYFNTESWLWDCKRCGQAGNRKSLLRHFGDEDKVEYLPGSDPAMRRKVLSEATEVAAEMLLNNPKILEYLKDRGLSLSTILDKRYGYVPASWSLNDSLVSSNKRVDLISAGVMTGQGQDFFSDRITIPYCTHGDVVQLRGKDPHGKYVTPFGDSVRLYNVDSLLGAEEAVITEGEFDAAVVEQALALATDARWRAVAVVGLAGADSLPEGFASYFAHCKRVFVALDPDDTGKKAALKIKELLGSKAVIVELPSALPKCDWTEYLRAKTDEHPHGGHGWRDVVSLLDAAQSAGRRLFTAHDAYLMWKKVDDTVGGIPTGFSELDSWIRPGLKPGQIMIPLARTGVGKSSPVNSLVDTPTGVRRWGDLQAGDQVWGRAGTPTTIVGVYDRGVLETWRVKFSDGTEVLCGEDHIWRVQYRYGKRNEWTERDMTTADLMASDLKSRRAWRFRIPMTEPVQYSTAALPVEPYTLGALIANGYLEGSATLTTPDRDVVARIRQTYTVTETTGIAACPRFTVRKVIGAIRALGLEVRSPDKFIPEMYLRAGVDQRVALLQGLLDGDGASRANDRRKAVNYFTSSKQLAQDVVTLVQSLGGTAMVRWHRGGTEGVISIMLPEGVEPFGTPRKGRKAVMRHQHVAHRAIVAIERTGVMEHHRCIKVDAADSLYLAGTGFHVTHNTNFLSNIAWYNRHRPTLYISLEMTAAEIYERLRRIAHFWNPLASDDEIAAHFAKLRIVDARMKPGDLIALCEEYADETGERAHLAFVDYVGYFANQIQGGSPYERTTRAVMTLKEEAKAAQVGLISPHQVSRVAEEGKPLAVSDARDSGAIEETADILLGLWRPADAVDRSGQVATGVNLNLLKNRNGVKNKVAALNFSQASLVLVDKATPASRIVDDENHLMARGESYEAVRAMRIASASKDNQLRVVS